MSAGKKYGVSEEVEFGMRVVGIKWVEGKAGGAEIEQSGERRRRL
jgi:hypothetical protein